MNYFLIFLICYLLYRLIKSNLFFIRFNKKNDVRKNTKKIFIDSKDLIEADFDEIIEGDNKNE